MAKRMSAKARAEAKKAEEEAALAAEEGGDAETESDAQDQPDEEIKATGHHVDPDEQVTDTPAEEVVVLDPNIVAMQEQMAQMMSQISALTTHVIENQAPPVENRAVDLEAPDDDAPTVVQATSTRVYAILIDAILPPNGGFDTLTESCTEQDLLDRGADIQWLETAGIIEDRGVQLVQAE